MACDRGAGDAARMTSVAALLDLELRDAQGHPFRLASMATAPLVVVFVRHFG